MQCHLQIALLATMVFCASCNIMEIKPQLPIHLPALSGRWWTFRWMPPKGFDLDVLLLSYTWYVKYLPTGKLSISIAGRYANAPKKCISQQAVLYPSETPGYFQYRAPKTHLRVYELFFVRTDYLTYSVDIGCSPCYSKACVPMAEVRTRMPFAGPELRKFINKVITFELGLDPNDFLDIHAESSLYPVCPIARERY